MSWDKPHQQQFEGIYPLCYVLCVCVCVWKTFTLIGIYCKTLLAYNCLQKNRRKLWRFVFGKLKNKMLTTKCICGAGRNRKYPSPDTYRLNACHQTQGLAPKSTPVGGKYCVQLHSTTCYNSFFTLSDGKFSILFRGFSSPDPKVA